MLPKSCHGRYCGVEGEEKKKIGRETETVEAVGKEGMAPIPHIRAILNVKKKKMLQSGNWQNQIDCF
jgi:hypothetical protein